jgi:CDP-6-deoxy-D-xylo-4-hexulose-3-dehydrase
MVFSRMKNYKYPLLSDAFSNADISAAKKVLVSRQITMSKITSDFEKKFAQYLGVRFALMVNSGSSANLLALSLICNPQRKKRLLPGDEVIIPAICWSTSLWPIVQHGLVPVFVDVDKNNFNVDVSKLKKAITSKTRAILCVHVLGLSANMQEVINIAKKNNLIIIEDTCESFGTRYCGKLLGSFGDAGTFSFYYSHQITSGEGGMIICKNSEDYEILHALRSHGWSRHPSTQKRIMRKYPNLDPRFIFINSGYNLRPTEIQAALVASQFKRKDIFKMNREYNKNKIINEVYKLKKYTNQIQFLQSEKNIKPSWFGLPILLNYKYKNKKINYLNYLTKMGIETRPIISGNFMNQPAIELYKLNKKKQNFVNAQFIEDLGFFIGLHTKKITSSLAKYLAFHLLKIDEL